MIALSMCVWRGGVYVGVTALGCWRAMLARSERVAVVAKTALCKRDVHWFCGYMYVNNDVELLVTFFFQAMSITAASG